MFLLLLYASVWIHQVRMLIFVKLPKVSSALNTTWHEIVDNIWCEVILVSATELVWLCTLLSLKYVHGCKNALMNKSKHCFQIDPCFMNYEQTWHRKNIRRSFKPIINYIHSLCTSCTNMQWIHGRIGTLYTSIPFVPWCSP